MFIWEYKGTKNIPKMEEGIRGIRGNKGDRRNRRNRGNNGKMEEVKRSK